MQFIDNKAKDVYDKHKRKKTQTPFAWDQQQPHLSNGNDVRVINTHYINVYTDVIRFKTMIPLLK